MIFFMSRPFPNEAVIILLLSLLSCCTAILLNIRYKSFLATQLMISACNQCNAWLLYDINALFINDYKHFGLTAITHRSLIDHLLLFGDTRWLISWSLMIIHRLYRLLTSLMTKISIFFFVQARYSMSWCLLLGMLVTDGHFRCIRSYYIVMIRFNASFQSAFPF